MARRKEADAPQPGLYTKRESFERMRAQLENERSSFMPHWRELGDHILPRRPRFASTDVNRGDRRNTKIIDSTATLAARTLRSGMMSGVTSPARPWFRLTTPDPTLNETESVKDWLYFVSERMSTVFLKSNLYNVLPIVYGDIGVFATGAIGVEEDFEDVVRFYPFPIGSYSIAQDARLRVNVFSRTFRMTVRQIVERFGRPDPLASRIDWSGISALVKQYYDNQEYETWIEVTHVIRPNEDFDPRKLHAKYKRYSSVYYETGSVSDYQGSLRDPSNERFLRESGYDYFPILCPRWEVTGEDVWGTACPGMDSLGDIKQLQLGERRAMQAIEKMINPPMVAPVALKNQKSSLLPGDVTYVDVRDGMQGFRPAQEVNVRLVELENKQNQVRERIKRAFFEDLFLMLSDSDRRQITAREVDERHEEKLLALGPVLEQLNQDLLDPLIVTTFQIMDRQGLIPEPPDELKQAPLRVEYISIMAQAQKLIGIEGIERFMGFVGQLVQQAPEARDKVDIDQTIDVYGEMTSIPPGIIRPDDKVEEIRQERAKQQQAQAQQQQIAQAADSAQKLSQTDTSGQNALTQLMQQAQAGSLVPSR